MRYRHRAPLPEGGDLAGFANSSGGGFLPVSVGGTSTTVARPGASAARRFICSPMLRVPASGGGADPAVVTGWIAEVEVDRRHALAVLNQPTAQPAPRLTREQISDLVTRLGDIITVLRQAESTDRAEVCRQLGLRLTYQPGQQKVRVQVQPGADTYGEMVRVRGAT